MADGDAQRWDAKYAERPLPQPAATEALESVERWLPATGGALDVAGGDGAHAVWLAQRGLDVTLCDVSAVALHRADQVATSCDVSLRLVRADLDRDALPLGPWDLVLCTNYLQRSLWPVVANALAPGGVAIWLHPTVQNLLRHPKPSKRYLLEAGEARAVLERSGLSILLADESWIGGRHLSRVVGRRA